MRVDVLIIGGGPSGAAAAITLARAGLKVALVERTAYNTERVGETLPPEICAPLVQLGVWERFMSAGHQQTPGIVSCWGSSQPQENDFIFNPYGCGWHIDRAQFDRMLAMAACECGAHLFLSTRARRCFKGDGPRWIIEAERDAGSIRFHADYIIEAVGRAGGPDRCGPERRHYDHLVGCVAFLKLRRGRTPDELRTVIEACPEGWWYSTQLPKGKLILAFMTDSDLIPANRDNAMNLLLQRLQATLLTRRWLDLYAPPTTFRRYAADSYLRETEVDGRLRTGDSAIAFDPLSSQGVLNALVTGQKAAASILGAQAGSESNRREYFAELESVFQTYLETRLMYYRREQRWPESVFWRRRHNAQPELLDPSVQVRYDFE